MKATTLFDQEFRPKQTEDKVEFEETLNYHDNYYNVVLDARLTLAKYGLVINYSNL